MIAVVKARTVRTLEELAAQSRGAAGQDLLQDLSMPLRHDRAKAFPVIGSQLLEQLMNGQTLATVSGGVVHQRLLMNSSSRF